MLLSFEQPLGNGLLEHGRPAAGDRAWLPGENKRCPTSDLNIKRNFQDRGCVAESKAEDCGRDAIRNFSALRNLSIGFAFLSNGRLTAPFSWYAW